MTDKSKRPVEANKLKSASKDILYVLATIAGEPKTPKDFKIAKENARLWNGYWTQNWNKEQHQNFKNEHRETLQPTKLEASDLKLIRAECDRRGFENIGLPDPLGTIDFQDTEFTGPAIFEDFIFTRFAGFHNVVFTKPANFKGVTFMEYARFDSAEFMGNTEFNNATFMEYADFGNAVFSKRVFFHGVIFKTSIDFSTAEFKSHPPAFYDATMSENIIWTRAKFPSVRGLDARIAVQHKDAYERLALMMSKLEKHHDQHLFFRKEMQVRRQIDKNWKAGVDGDQSDSGSVALFFNSRIKWVDSRISMVVNFLYELFSNYGYGFGRAFAWWSLNLIFGALVIFPYKEFMLAPPNPSSILTGLKLWGSSLSLSFSNAHSFLGLSRYGMENVYTEFKAYNLVLPFHFTWTIQAILGILFLFFLILTLRNRFRLG